jgi:hypothetical protein
VVNTSAKASRYFTASLEEALLAASLIGKQKSKIFVYRLIIVRER